MLSKPWKIAKNRTIAGGWMDAQRDSRPPEPAPGGVCSRGHCQRTERDLRAHSKGQEVPCPLEGHGAAPLGSAGIGGSGV